MTASLAYRKNEAAILRGDAPEKYTRLLPFITGAEVLDLGSAEGVLSCLLARTPPRRRVVALERSSERHEAACSLYEAWTDKYRMFGVSQFVKGDIADRLDLMAGIDTLVAVRMIYYLGDNLDAVFAKAAKLIPHVVLCGNKNRAARWKAGLPNDHDRADNYYASAEGMRDVLTRHGYEIATEVLQGDPIVVGRRAEKI